MSEEEKKSKAVDKYSRSERKKTENEVRRLIGKGKSDDSICQTLGLKPKTLALYKNRILDVDRDKFERMSNAGVYSTYCTKADNLIQELDEVRQKFRNRGQWTALVAAIKQKHEIQKDVFKVGQELGFIEKKASEVSVANEVTYALMSTEEVKAEVEKERAKLNAMAGMNVIEMRPEILESLDGDTERIKKFVPMNVLSASKEQKPTEKHRSIKVKVKQKMKLKK